MCEPTTIALTTMAVAGGYQAYSQHKQGIAENDYYDYLAQNSRAEGDAVMKVGQKQSELIQDSAKFKGTAQKKKAAQVLSSQRAAMAANGIDLSSVTAQDIVSDTMSKTSLDELAIKYNADMNSWSTMQDSKYKKWSATSQGNQYEMAGANARSAGNRSAFSTLIGTASSMAMSGKGLLPKGENLGAGTTSNGIKVPSRYKPPR